MITMRVGMAVITKPMMAMIKVGMKVATVMVAKKLTVVMPLVVEMMKLVRPMLETMVNRQSGCADCRQSVSMMKPDDHNKRSFRGSTPAGGVGATFFDTCCPWRTVDLW